MRNVQVEENDVFLGSTHIDLPKEKDWRLEGAVTEGIGIPILQCVKKIKWNEKKMQFQWKIKKSADHVGRLPRLVRKDKWKNIIDMDSIWFLSFLGAIEGQIFLNKNGPLQSLSAQNLIDCSTTLGSLLKARTYSNEGCFGGSVDEAYEYVKDNGIDTDEKYPYTASFFNICKYIYQKSKISISGYVDIPSKDEQKLQEAVATVGPISVAIDAGHTSFQHYKSGIYHEPNCSSTTFDHRYFGLYCIFTETKWILLIHSVLVVGYGTDAAGKDYYIVKVFYYYFISKTLFYSNNFSLFLLILLFFVNIVKNCWGEHWYDSLKLYFIN